LDAAREWRMQTMNGAGRRIIAMWPFFQELKQAAEKLEATKNIVIPMLLQSCKLRFLLSHPSQKNAVDGASSFR
jgi:hypothetical protein